MRCECLIVSVNVARYMLCADYDAYIKCQEQVSATYAVRVSFCFQI